MRLLNAIIFFSACFFCGNLLAQNQSYLGDGPGLLLREGADDYTILRVTGNFFEQIQIEKSSKAILSTKNLGPKSFQIRATANNDYLKLDTVKDQASGLADFYLQRLSPGGNVLWENHFGDNSAGLDYFARDLAESTSGAIAMVGHSNNYPLYERVSKFILVSADGQQVLSERDFSCEFQKIEPSVNNGFYVAGQIRDTSLNQYIGKLWKLDSVGNLLWEWTPASIPPLFQNPPLGAIKATSDGGVLLSEKRSPGYATVLKLDGNSQMQWTYSIPLSGTYYSTSYVLSNDDGGCTFAFLRGLGGGGQSVTEERTYLMRLDHLGNLMWTSLFEGYCDVPGPMGSVAHPSRLDITQIIPTASGGFAAIGYGGDGLFCNQTVLIETDGNGSVASQEAFQTGIAPIQCIPNPAGEKTMVNFFSEKAERANLELFDLQGRRLYSMEISIVEGINSIELTLENCPSGIYTIRIGGGNTHMLSRFIVLK